MSYRPVADPGASFRGWNRSAQRIDPNVLGVPPIACYGSPELQGAKSTHMAGQPVSWRNAIPSAATPPPPGDWRTIVPIDENELPDSDGQPMADNTRQELALVYTRGALGSWYRSRPEVTVAANLLLHYPLDSVDPHTGQHRYGQLAPDVFIAEAPMRHRPSYRIGPGQPPPRFVMEALSQRTATRDMVAKRTIYESLGVHEYFLFDSREPLRKTRLTGLRLHRGRYREISRIVLPNGAAGIASEVLRLVARVDAANDLRWFDPEAGEDLRYHHESERDRIAERDARLDAELRAREARLRLLEAERKLAASARRMGDAGMAPAQIAEILDIDIEAARRAISSA